TTRVVRACTDGGGGGCCHWPRADSMPATSDNISTAACESANRGATLPALTGRGRPHKVNQPLEFKLIQQHHGERRVSEGSWHKVATLSDIGPGEMKQVRIGPRYVALYNVAGTIYATDDICTHADASLSEGYLESDVVECPLHQGRFHVPSGKA